jgi:DNA invertase Pin-like site-specific DNA recombinase
LSRSSTRSSAQREACAAFINSQRHEGWTEISSRYDDGGVSGGTVERPALARLMQDIQTGQVHIVVVYKIDRLTRSLFDFAKLVELFDRHGVSFVSVTQQFNTTTSMGRLTLNVLLSFAQFEREVTGERIRDKIAASRAKGMWMGGNPSLGYDIRDRRLGHQRRGSRTGLLHLQTVPGTAERPEAAGGPDAARASAPSAGPVRRAGSMADVTPSLGVRSITC